MLLHEIYGGHKGHIIWITKTHAIMHCIVYLLVFAQWSAAAGSLSTARVGMSDLGSDGSHFVDSSPRREEVEQAQLFERKPFQWGMPPMRALTPQPSVGKNQSLPPPAEVTQAALAALPAPIRISYYKRKITRMLDWAEDVGIQISPRLQFNVTAHGTSIIAKRNVPDKYDIIVVPLTMLVWNRTADQLGPFGWYQQWEKPEEPVVMFLLHELSQLEKSKYRYVVSMLFAKMGSGLSVPDFSCPCRVRSRK